MQLFLSFCFPVFLLPYVGLPAPFPTMERHRKVRKALRITKLSSSAYSSNSTELLILSISKLIFCSSHDAFELMALDSPLVLIHFETYTGKPISPKYTIQSFFFVVAPPPSFVVDNPMKRFVGNHNHHTNQYELV
jgi:hypothetical protein